MRGLMQDHSLLIPMILDYASTNFGEKEIITRRIDQKLTKLTYRQIHHRVRKIATSLKEQFQVLPGERIATLAFNHHRHFELYFSVSATGGILHTLNPRLSINDLDYILQHAQDRLLFIDDHLLLGLLPLLKANNTLEHIIILGDDDQQGREMADEIQKQMNSSKKLWWYEDLLQNHSPIAQWDDFPETAAAALCYTSGTTGRPKGVLYSHRSTVLHAMSLCMPNHYHISETERFLPLVPMFHANAWGIVYAAPMAGSDLILAGRSYEAQALVDLINELKITKAAAVPAVWNRILLQLEGTDASLPTLKEIIVGGGLWNLANIKLFQEKYKVKVVQSWGMTETSPLGTVLRQKDDCPLSLGQGKPAFGVKISLKEGINSGELMVSGPWICSGYFQQHEMNLPFQKWFPTGDQVDINHNGEMLITDRVKDLIKSGGEWISSQQMESWTKELPHVQEAAVIGVFHKEWDERPIMIVEVVQGKTLNSHTIISHLEKKFAKWWLPDSIIFMDQIPLSGTGKVQKKILREKFHSYLVDNINPTKSF